MASSSSIIDAMNNITLEDEEEDVLAFEIGGTKGNNQGFTNFDAKLCVVARFLTEGRVDFQAMQQTLAALWKPGRGVYMKELDTNLYLFQFYHELDVKRILEGSPWSFNRRALVMARMKEGENPGDVSLNTMDLWIQIHDLKPGFMSENVIMEVGNFIGKYVESCKSNFKEVWRGYMRVRVSLDLSKPLKRRMKVRKSGDEWFWITFKYENVPTFCFICGFLGHSDKFCSRLFDTPEHEIVKPYGVWMRAPLRSQVKPIGAKWLRSGSDEDPWNTGKEGERMNSVSEGNNHIPKSSPQTMQVDTAGGLSGRKIQTTTEGVNLGIGGDNITDPIIQGSTSIIIDSKKRRTDDGLGHNNGMGRSTEMSKESDGEDDMFVENGPVNVIDPKNVKEAGTQGGTRLAL